MAEKRGRRRSRAARTAPTESSGSSLDTPVVVEGSEGDSDGAIGMKSGKMNTMQTDNVEVEGRSTMSADETSSLSTGGTLADAGAAVKGNVVGGLKGIQEIETTAVSVIGRAASDALTATRSVAVEGVSAIKDLATGALQALTDVGTGLTSGATALSTNLVSGVTEVGGEILTTAQRAARGVVSGAAELGSDVGAVTNNTARGVVSILQDVGGDVGGLLKTTAEGTVDSVLTIGTEAIKAVSSILVTAVHGVKDVLNAALPQR